MPIPIPIKKTPLRCVTRVSFGLTTANESLPIKMFASRAPLLQFRPFKLFHFNQIKNSYRRKLPSRRRPNHVKFINIMIVIDLLFPFLYNKNKKSKK